MTDMDSTSFEGFVLDPAKCSKLSMEEKRELVYEISKWSNGAPELLQSWSRQDILQILCAEMGKERKYTGLTKLKIIENLLKVVSEKASLETDIESQPSATSGQRTAKRPRKTDHPSRLPTAANTGSINIVDNDLGNNLYCKNSACRAKLVREDRFCKRCSCCICYQYDDNKDPSLWLTCSSEPPFEGNSCGLSTHLECALKKEKSGIAKDGGLDGSFYCVSCGKVNDLLGCWRKQMITARDTRRVDILCYRVSLSQKLISCTKRYQKLYGIVDEAMKKLEEDVGPLTGLPVKKARGIVNRLSSGQEVQRLCAFAVESLDSMLSDTGSDMSSGDLVQGTNMITPVIRFENVGTSSLTVNLGTEGPSRENGMGYTLWHRMFDETDYPAEPTCTLFAPNTRFSVSGLNPATEYLFKVVSFNSIRELGMREVRFQTYSDDNDKFTHPKKSLKLERSHSPVTNCSALSNPSSVEDENNNDNENEKGKSIIAYCKKNEDIISGDLSNEAVGGIGTVQCGTRGDSVSMMDEEPNMGSVPNGDVDLENNEDSPEGQTIEDTSTENDSNTPVQSGLECVPFAGSSDTAIPITPCKLENFKDGPGRKIRPKNSNKAVDKEEEPQDGGSSKKRCAENGDRDFGYYVKVIRWLECDGHIETSFRQKFLTWYSLRATPQEVRVVKVFVDTLIEDPPSLAGQLVDTFSDVISNKRSSSVVPTGFCLRLWH